MTQESTNTENGASSSDCGQNEAVEYVSQLIDQLRGADERPSEVAEDRADVNEEAASRLEIQRDSERSPRDSTGSAGDRAVIDPYEKSLESGLAAEFDAADEESDLDESPVENLAEQQDDKRHEDEAEQSPAQEEDDFSSEAGYAFRRSMLHNLREATQIATNTTIDLDDCVNYAYRSYLYALCGAAGAIFSTILVLMCPQPGSFGFAASAVSFAFAVGFGLAYTTYFRLLNRKLGLLQRIDVISESQPQVPEPTSEDMEVAGELSTSAVSG